MICIMCITFNCNVKMCSILRKLKHKETINKNFSLSVSLYSVKGRGLNGLKYIFYIFLGCTSNTELMLAFSNCAGDRQFIVEGKNGRDRDS